jgi:hypothetical protein
MGCRAWAARMMMTGEVVLYRGRGEDVDCRKRFKLYRPVLLLQLCEVVAWCAIVGAGPPVWGVLQRDSRFGQVEEDKVVYRRVRWFGYGKRSRRGNVPGGAWRWSKGDDKPSGVVCVAGALGTVTLVGDSGAVCRDASGDTKTGDSFRESWAVGDTGLGRR